MNSIHDMQFGGFYFPKQKICAQGCGRVNLERMAIVEIISLKRVSAIHFNQKPIRVETCNARSQLPNIQCELIG